MLCWCAVKKLLTHSVCHSLCLGRKPRLFYINDNLVRRHPISPHFIAPDLWLPIVPMWIHSIPLTTTGPYTWRCWSEVVPECCMVWSAAACHWWGNWPAVWTAVCLYENWWATLGTFALIIWTVFFVLLLTLLDNYLMWQLHFYTETSHLTLYWQYCMP